MRLLSALFLVGLLLAGVPAGADTLVIGTITKDADKELKQLGPLAEYLKVELTGSGVDDVTVVVVPTMHHMVEAMRTGRVHLYIDSPFLTAKVGIEAGGVPLVRRWRGGVSEYWSEIIVRAESDIHSLDDLRGRALAFEDPDSTSGHLLPRAHLLEAGHAIEVLNHPNESRRRDRINAVFAMSDRTAILWLFANRVHAVATDPKYSKRIEAERPGSIRKLARTNSVPRQVVMHSPTLSTSVVEKIGTILVGMDSSTEGQRVLELMGKDRFDRFPDGERATFEPIERQLRLLDGSLPPPDRAD